MKHKITKRFEFTLPLRKKIVRDLRVIREHYGDLVVSGTAYFYPNVSTIDTEDSRYDVDIEEILYNGVDVKPLLEADPFETTLGEVMDAAIRNASELFNYDNVIAL